MSEGPLLRMRGIGKRFGRLEVLHDVALELEPGQVLVLAGANGAGKSTLVKILAGVYSDWDGTVEMDGRPIRPRRPQEATALGIACIHQELSLVAPMTVADNLFLGRERCRFWGGIDYRYQNVLARKWLERLGLDVEIHRRVEEFPIAVQQSIEIAKALSMDARIIIMDEPTSALTEVETERLFEWVDQLKQEGHAVLFISHKMEEIYRVADRITVLRDGRLVGTRMPSELSQEGLVEWMVGRRLTEHTRTPSLSKKPRLTVEGLTVANPALPDRPWAKDVSFALSEGEVLGLAGLAGSGVSEVLGAVFGRLPRAGGRVEIEGDPVPSGKPSVSLKKGLALLTNDRKAEGLTLPRSVTENVTLASLARFSPNYWLQPKKEKSAVQEVSKELEIQAPDMDAPVGTLSGGNQQKTLLARLWLTEPKVLLLDDPTRGIDVATKAKVHRLIDDWTREGVAVVLASWNCRSSCPCRTVSWSFIVGWCRWSYVEKKRPRKK